MNKCKWIVAAAAALAISPAVSMAVVIDDFSEGAVNMSQAGVGSQSSTQMGSSTAIIGEYRDMDLEVTASLAGLGTDADVLIVPGLLNFSNAAGNQATLLLTWDGLGVPGAGLGGVDLTEAGIHTGIGVDFLVSDLGATMTFTVVDTSGNESKLSQMTGVGANSLFFDYNSFVPTVLVSDFTAIDTISMELFAETNGDYLIQLLQTANPNPEPATAMLGAMGLGGLAAGLRRRRTA